MPALAVRQSVLDGAARQQQAAFWGVAAVIRLGVPALYEATPGGVRWYIYDDSRLTLNDLSWLGAFAAHVTDIPDTWHVPILPSLHVDLDTLRSEARAFLALNRVAPAEYAEGQEPANPYQAVLDDNGAPAWIQAAATVPASWTAVNDE